MEIKPAMVAITAFVVITVIAAVMMPVLDDATTVNETFDNTPYAYYQMKELEAGDLWTLNDGTWSLNGDPITTGNNGGISVIAISTGVVRQNGQVRGSQYSSNVLSTAEVVTVSDSDVLKINTNSTLGYADGYGATNEGDYVLKTYDSKAYVKGDTPLWATGITNLINGSSYTMVIHIEGTIKDGFTITATKVTNTLLGDTFTIGDVTVNSTPVSGYNDLYSLESISFDVTGTATVDGVSSSETVTATYSTFVLPKEVTAERSVHFTDGENAILLAIPALVIVALIIGILAIAIRSKLE